MSSRWSPSAHPRDPIGRFSLVGGRGTQVPTSRMGNTDHWVDPSFVPDERSFSDLDVISNDGWGDLPRMPELEVFKQRINRAKDAQELGAVMQEAFDHPDLDDQDVLQLMAPMNERGGELIRQANAAKSATPWEIERPEGWTQDDWRGMSAAQAEKDLHGFYSGDLERIPGETTNASAGGNMNDGVHIHRLRDRQGRRVTTGVVVKGAQTPDEADAEVLTSELGHVIGAPSPVVINNPLNNKEVAMEQVIGHPGYGFGSHTPESMMYGDRNMIKRYRDSSARLAMLDQLSGNRDRHDGNWLLTDDGTVVGIDNGLAEGARGHYRSVEEIRDIQNGYMAMKGQRTSEWAKRIDEIPTDEIKSWAPGIQAMRSEYEKRGRLDWYEGLLTNYTFILRERSS